jgi:hypothetical protein
MHFEYDRSSGNGAHTRGRGVLQGSWWPVDPKLVFDQIASPVPEIMDGGSSCKHFGEKILKKETVRMPSYIKQLKLAL